MKLLISALTALTLFALTSCGGGTSGSGLRSIEGQLQGLDGAPLEGVTVVVEATGAQTVSNSSGRFSIISEEVGGPIVLLLESRKFRTKYQLAELPGSSSQSALEITVDTILDVAFVKHLSVKAAMAGLCDYYFENRETIRQSNRVPQGTICSLNVEVRGDGNRLENFPVALEYAGCHGQSPWKVLETTSTGSGRHLGFAEINFEFIDSEEFCRYRVVAPFELPDFPIVTYPIDTFTEQKFFPRR